MGRPRKWSDDTLLNALKQMADEIGRTPTCRDIGGRPGMPSAGAYRRRFATLSHAAELAGIKPRLRGGWRRKGQMQDREAYLRELAEGRARMDAITARKRAYWTGPR